MNMMNMEI